MIFFHAKRQSIHSSAMLDFKFSSFSSLMQDLLSIDIHMFRNYQMFNHTLLKNYI